MNRIVAQEDSRRVAAVALALWGASVALAAWEGVFAKLSPVTFALLAIFAVAYAAASYGLDRGLRGLAEKAGRPALWSAALAADGILVAAALGLARADAPLLESLARFPYALAVLFVAPLAVALHVAALGSAAARGRLRSARGRSPGANPAAT